MAGVEFPISRLRAIDAWIDSGLYKLWSDIKDCWSAYSSFLGRFDTRGLPRTLNELVCEALTLGTGGLAVILASSAGNTKQGLFTKRSHSFGRPLLLFSADKGILDASVSGRAFQAAIAIHPT